MAPDQRGEVSDVVVADIHSVRPDLADGLLHVDGVPMHDGIESEAKGAKLLFLPLLKGTSDFAAFAVVNAPAEAMAQFLSTTHKAIGSDETGQVHCPQIP